MFALGAPVGATAYGRTGKRAPHAGVAPHDDDLIKVPGRQPVSMSHGPWMALRSLTRDGEVTKKKLAHDVQNNWYVVRK